MQKIVVLVSVAFGSLLICLFLVGYSPVACGCISPFEDLLATSGVFSIAPSSDISASGIEARLNQALVGTQVEFGEHPYSASEGCKQARPTQIICKVPVASSRFLTQGMIVTYETDGKVLKSASVRNAYWVWP